MSVKAEVIQGDALEVLRAMPDESVNCVVSSPPYWNLRNYGVEGEYGQEPTINEYVEKLVAVFAEVRRVLRKDGTCFLNIADTYASAWPCARPSKMGAGSLENGKRANRKARLPEGLKEKDRCGIPERLVLALQDDGWYWRDEIIWHKIPAMPMSRKDATTAAHEKIYLLTRSEKYWSDFATLSTPLAESTEPRRSRQDLTLYEPDGQTVHRGIKANKKFGGPNSGFRKSKALSNAQPSEKPTEGEHEAWESAWPRSIWAFAPQAAEGHPAAFPPELPKRCILAGCPPGAMVLDPFVGSGTTCLVAVALGRNAIGIDLKASNCETARKRVLGVTPGMFTEAA